MRLPHLLPVMLCALVASAGCSQEEPTKAKLGPINIDPLPRTPQQAVVRWIGEYEHKNVDGYSAMFTGDFTYEFSNETDPTLVNQYSNGWFKIDERESASHLFSGFTVPGGTKYPAASSIYINLATTSAEDDTTRGVDPATHKILITRVDGSVTIPQMNADPLTYVITNNLSAFYLVRGDVAVNLEATQPADDQHWYIYRWVDLTSDLAGVSPQAVLSRTWGALKAIYR